mgnify:CR=1 FL=1
MQRGVRDDLLAITRIAALLPLGLIGVRRGQDQGRPRLEEALRLAEAAKAAGKELMTGNMVGTSLAMAPAFVIAQMSRFVDLDGHVPFPSLLIAAVGREGGMPPVIRVPSAGRRTCRRHLLLRSLHRRPRHLQKLAPPHQIILSRQLKRRATGSLFACYLNFTFGNPFNAGPFTTSPMQVKREP